MSLREKGPPFLEKTKKACFEKRVNRLRSSKKLLSEFDHK